MLQSSEKNGKIYVTHINIRQSIFFLMLKLILLDLIALFVTVTYFSSAANKFLPEVINKLILSYDLPFFLALVFLKFSLTIYVVMRWITEYYEIWPHALMYSSGIIWRNQEKHPFSQMRSVKIEQGFLGKIFGFGTIYLYNWYLEKNTALYLIHNPVKYYHIIEGLIPKSENDREIFLDETVSKES
jgi:membrane protein YdbS with pleckstrin-like domain